jgi:hypothetical protein
MFSLFSLIFVSMLCKIAQCTDVFIFLLLFLICISVFFRSFFLFTVSSGGGFVLSPADRSRHRGYPARGGVRRLLRGAGFGLPPVRLGSGIWERAHYAGSSA